jgi:hypothetical protein
MLKFMEEDYKIQPEDSLKLKIRSLFEEVVSLTAFNLYEDCPMSGWNSISLCLGSVGASFYQV